MAERKGAAYSIKHRKAVTEQTGQAPHHTKTIGNYASRQVSPELKTALEGFIEAFRPPSNKSKP